MPVHPHGMRTWRYSWRQTKSPWGEGMSHLCIYRPLCNQFEEHTRASHHVIVRVMAIDPIHTQRFKETAERMTLEVRAKVTSQRQRVTHLDPFRLKRAIELCTFLLQHLQVESVIVGNKQNVRSKEIEKLMERILWINPKLVEIVH